MKAMQDLQQLEMKTRSLAAELTFEPVFLLLAKTEKVEKEPQQLSFQMLNLMAEAGLRSP